MDAAMNVTLLAVGLAGALTAFFGNTLRENDVGLRRVTKVGWWSIAFLGAAFVVGVGKEIRQYKRDQADQRRTVIKEREAADAILARKQIQADLTLTRAHLNTASATLRSTADALRVTTQQLAEARAKLDALQPAMVTALYKFTERIPRESDFAFFDVYPSTVGFDHRRRPISTETGKPLEVYGGDEVHYYTLCSDGESRSERPLTGLYLYAGGDRYELSGGNGVIRVAGPIGVPLGAVIESRMPVRCSVKLVVRSTDRTRARQQLRDITDLLRDLQQDESSK